MEKEEEEGRGRREGQRRSKILQHEQNRQQNVNNFDPDWRTAYTINFFIHLKLSGLKKKKKTVQHIYRVKKKVKYVYFM